MGKCPHTVQFPQLSAALGPLQEARHRLGVVAVPPQVDDDVAQELDKLEAEDDGHPQVQAERTSKRGEEGLGLG